MADDELTCDPIWRGRLTLWQPRSGYRFSIDPLLLIDFMAPPFGRLVDLGAGVGVVALGLLARDAAARATLVELQGRLAALARQNLAANQMQERAEVLEAELGVDRLRELGGQFDLAVSNPPYRTLDEGPPSPDAEAAIAQHELRLSLPVLAAEMRRMLRPDGRAALVFPAGRTPALLAALDAAELRPTRLRAVHPRAEEPACRVLVEAYKGRRGPLVIAPPLVLRDERGYTAEASRLLGDG